MGIGRRRAGSRDRGQLLPYHAKETQLESSRRGRRSSGVGNVFTAAGRGLRRALPGRRSSKGGQRYGSTSYLGEEQIDDEEPQSMLMTEDEVFDEGWEEEDEDRKSRDGLVLEERDRVVYIFETILRQGLLLLLAYWLGAKRPQYLPLVLKGVELGTTAWVTCLSIIIVSWRMRRRAEIRRTESHASASSLAGSHSHQGEELSRALVTNGENSPLLTQDFESSTLLEEDEDVLLSQPHNELENLIIMNVDTLERVIPNSEPTPLSNDLFEGVVLPMIRTPDADGIGAEGTEENTRFSDYFRSKQRRFEWQFQLKLKKVPDGSVFVSTEVDEPFKLGMIQRAVVGAVMGFMKKMNDGFHYSLTGGDAGGKMDATAVQKGEFAKPHCSFVVESSMNRIVVTKPGEPLPKLGQEIVESTASLNRRKKGGKVEWNTSDTYTFSLWSAYADFLQWKCMNFPGIPSFSFTSITGDQPAQLTLYSLKSDAPSDRHFRKDLVTSCHFEISVLGKTTIGPCAKKWIAKQQPKVLMQAEKQVAFDDEMEVLNVEEEDAATIAELGAGMYVRSGEKIVLSEATSDDSSSFVTIGGGFAVLQSQAPSTIVIEKMTKKRRKSTSIHSDLIRSGDGVMIKLLSSGDDSGEVKYLSVHRGWWLKWVANKPTTNGYFTVHTNETEVDPTSSVRSSTTETQTKYLTLGGSFWLRHHRWCRYEVGVSEEDSATYGGRMLGLYRNRTLDEFDSNMNPPDTQDMEELDIEDGEEAKSKKWMSSLRLSAQLVSTTTGAVASRSTEAEQSEVSTAAIKGDLQGITIGEVRLDVPAWIEMMHRTDRKRQFAYVVRACKDKGSYSLLSEVEEMEAYTIRLRTGYDLSATLRAGLGWLSCSNPTSSSNLSRATARPRPTSISPKTNKGLRISTTSPEVGKSTFDFSIQEEGSPTLTLPKLDPDEKTESGANIHIEPDMDLDSLSGDEDMSVDEEDYDSDTEEEPDEDGVTGVFYDDDGKPRRRGPRKRISNVAKTVRTGTAKTGKKVVIQSLKVGKGTVNAGRVFLGSVRPHKPPEREPRKKAKGIARADEKRKGRDHHVAINRAVKLSRRRKTRRMAGQPPALLAGQLSAADQSCRTASHVLSEMSSVPSSSTVSTKFNNMLTSQLSSRNELDSWFLRGGAVELGVTPIRSDDEVLHECIIARCLWESHWREEWVGLYSKRLSFYAPLTKTPSLDLDFVDILSVRELDHQHCIGPLTGYPLIAVETAWTCYYLAFGDNAARIEFGKKLSNALTEHRNNHDAKSTEISHVWKGFHKSVQSSLVEGRGKWAPIVSNMKQKNRTILNARKMAFDTLDECGSIFTDIDGIASFAEGLLSSALSLSLDLLESAPDEFVNFLDKTSMLRSLPLDKLLSSGDTGFCVLVNIYHTLLQHSLLFNVDGPPNKRSVGHFMRCTCYEIGGDIFSLAEFQVYVIRGRMSQAVLPKPPYVEAPRGSKGHRFYALKKVDPRVNFVMNHGDESSAVAVPVLEAAKLDSQLDVATSKILEQVLIDTSKRIVFLPKICELYRHDFGNGEQFSCLNFCLQYLSPKKKEALKKMISDKSNYPQIKYRQPSEYFHACLQSMG